LKFLIFNKAIFHDNTHNNVTEIVSYCMSIMNEIQKKNVSFQLEYSIDNVKNEIEDYKVGKLCKYLLINISTKTNIKL